jgi:hypothetical protein
VIVLGTSRFHIARDSTAAVKVNLSRAALARLGRMSAVTVAIKASARDQAGRTGTAIRATTLRIRPQGT